MGRFEPLNAVIFLAADVATELRRIDPGTLTSVEEPGSPTLARFPTFLHEIIHWWQHAATTSGLIQGLSVAAQSISTARYLNDVGDGFAKPLLVALPDDAPVDHPAFLACHRWTECELGSGLLANPKRSARFVHTYPRYFRSVGASVLLLYTNVMQSVAASVDPEHAAFPTIDPWLEALQTFERDDALCFSRGEFIELPLGMSDVQEGQARVSELQFRHLTVDADEWTVARERGLLDDVYGTAFHVFLERTDTTFPEHPTDAATNLFLLLCDIALNPSAGYPDPIDSQGALVIDVHPGVRFLRLCAAAAEQREVFDFVRSCSFTAYTRASELLCDALGWKTPIEIAESAMRLIDGSPLAFDLGNADRPYADAPRDVPVHFTLARHRELMEWKHQVPHFFCWPGRFLTVDPTAEDDGTTGALMELLSVTSAPFVASDLDAGVDAIDMPGVSPEVLDRFVKDYFATLALYDLSRQWLGSVGEFRFDFSWKPQVPEQERDYLKTLFADNFGLSLAQIPTL